MNHKFGYLLAILLFSCATPVPATAQFVPVPNTPRAVVKGVEIGVWASQNAVLGTTVVVAKNVGGQWFGINPQEFVTDEDVAAAGGPEAYIESIAPKVNKAIADHFGGGSTAPPLTLDGKLNNALMLFKLTITPDGLAVLERK